MIISGLKGPVKHEDTKSINLENKALIEGGSRVKFTSKYNGTVGKFLSEDAHNEFKQIAEAMSDLMWEMENSGAAPVLPDGKVGGNCGVRLTVGSDDYLVISRSGKLAGHKMDPKSDVCLVEAFDCDPEIWQASYYSEAQHTVPSSDTPLHFACLQAHQKFIWASAPRVILHGHALETEEDAKQLNLPISTEETLFSTPEDTQALMGLFKKYSYPENTLFIRKGHGFILLADNFTEALDTFLSVVKPHIKH